MRVRLTIGTLAFVVAAAGCGKSAEQKAAEQAAQNVQQAAQAVQQGAQQGGQQGAAQVAQGLQQMAQGLQQGQAPAKLIDSDELKTLLPDIAGFEKKTRGEQMTMGMASFSRAEGNYTTADGNRSIKVEIQDTAFNQLLLAPLSVFMMSGYSEKSDDGYKKYASIGGMPGFEEWEKEPKHGKLTAIVANRFIVNVEGSDIENVDVIRKVIDSINLQKLAAMK